VTKENFMYPNLLIEDKLLQQALQISGLPNEQAVIHRALQWFIGQFSRPMPLSQPSLTLGAMTESVAVLEECWAQAALAKQLCADFIPPTVLETATTRSAIYQGPPLTLAQMQEAIEEEAGKHL
jgi:hypothetical protein